MSQFNLNRVGGIKYNLRLLRQYIRINWMAAIEFRMGFLTMIFQIIMSLFVWFVYWSVIFEKTSGNLAGWTARELLVWYALTEFGIGLLGLGSGLLALIFIIHQYGLEQYLSKPADVLVTTVADRMYILSIIRSVYGLIALITAIIIFELYSQLLLIFAGLIISISGVLLIIAIYIGIVSLSFFLGRINTVYMLFEDLEINLVRLPMQIFPKTVFLSLLFIYPIGLLATLPTLLIFGQWWFSSYGVFQVFGLVLLIPVITLLVLLIAVRFFNFSLKFYTPVGE